MILYLFFVSCFSSSSTGFNVSSSWISFLRLICFCSNLFLLCWTFSVLLVQYPVQIPRLQHVFLDISTRKINQYKLEFSFEFFSSHLITFTTMISFFHQSIKISSKTFTTISCSTKFTHISLRQEIEYPRESDLTYRIKTKTSPTTHVDACFTHSHLSVLLIKTEEKMCQRTNPFSLSFFSSSSQHHR